MKTSSKTYLLLILFFAINNFVFASKKSEVKIRVVYINGIQKTYNQNEFEQFNLNDVTIKQIQIENIDFNKNFKYLLIDKEVPRIYIYSKNLLIEQTGYAINHEFLSVKDNFSSINLTNIKNKEDVKIVIPRHRYKLFYSKLYFSNTPKSIENNNDLILFNIGFHLALAFFAIFWLLFINIKQDNLNKFYISLLFVTLISIINFMLRSNFIQIDNKIFPNLINYKLYNFIGCFDPLIYYYLYYFYFNLNKFKIIRIILYFNLIFWLGLAIIENTNFSNTIVSQICIIYLNCAAIIDFVSLLIFAIFILKFKWKEVNNKIVFLGLIMMLISAYEIAQVRIINIFNLSYSWVRLQGFSEKLVHFSTSINLTTLIIGTMFTVRKIYHTNKILDKQVQKQKEELNNAILETQSTLLNNLSKDLHDDLGQKLSVINFSLENLKLTNSSVEVNELKKLSVEVSNSIRDLSHWLSNFKFEQNTLSQIIHQDINRLKKILPVQINFESKDTSSLTISEKIILFRIYQELMNNSLKHSKPTRIDMHLSDSNFTFSDNGMNLRKENVDGIGLNNISERLHIINWKIERNEENSIGITNNIYRV